jgi:hypothetical protein
MAAPRRKTSGFSSEPLEKTQEEMEVQTPINLMNEEIEEISPEVKPLPQVEEIIPTEDKGPRFVESKQEEVAKVAATPTPVSVVTHPPKRNPRNIPRFSRYKQV